MTNKERQDIAKKVMTIETIKASISLLEDMIDWCDNNIQLACHDIAESSAENVSKDFTKLKMIFLDRLQSLHDRVSGFDED